MPQNLNEVVPIEKSNKPCLNEIVPVKQTDKKKLDEDKDVDNEQSK